MKAFANDANPEMNRWFNHLLGQALIARLTRQAVAPLLDAVNLRHGDRLLDVATGPAFSSGSLHSEEHSYRVTDS